MPAAACFRYKLFTWITDPRESGVADHRNTQRFPQQLQKLWQPRANVVLMKRQTAAAGFKTAEELTAVAGVFAGDHINGSQQVTCPRREVSEMRSLGWRRMS